MRAMRLPGPATAPTLAAIAMATAQGFDDSTVTDELALNFHLMHPGEDSAPGDPNVAYCLDGVYHLHYIVRHPWKGGTARLRDGKQSFCFIHVTSPDMLHWTWQTTKLQPSFTGHGIFSGTGFITREGKPAAMYPACPIRAVHLHHRGRGQPAQPLEQALPGAAHRRAGGQAGGPGRRPRSVPGRRHLLRLLRRRRSGVDQVHRPGHWRYVGPLLQHNLPDVALGEDTSCANLFPLGDKWMLLCISHQIGCRYYLGDWDAQAEQFVPQVHERMNWRRAGQSLTDPVYRDFFAPERRAHRRRAARDVGLAVHRRPGRSTGRRCSRCRAS